VSDLAVAAVGGLIGGALGVLAASLSAYWGPRKLEEWRERQREKHDYGPRKELLLKLLKDPRFETRSLERLRLVTGTTKEECRRLLIEIGARGVSMTDDEEGWALIERFPFDRPI
jgi:hypothetical protein